MTTMIGSRETAVERYRAAFDRARAGRVGEPVWLDVARRHAMRTFEEHGFPTIRDEDWRFTNVAPIADAAFRPAAEDDAVAGATEGAASFLIRGIDGPALVFVDGRFVPELSRQVSGAEAAAAGGSLVTATLRQALRASDARLQAHLGRHAVEAANPFTALNTSLFADGAFLFVPPGLVLEQPIQVLFFSSGVRPRTSTHPRLLLIAGAHSQVRVVESFAGSPGAAYFTNPVTELVAGEGAVVDHYRIQRESESAFHVGVTWLELGRSASMSSHSVAAGALLARQDAIAVLAGEGADCTLNGLYLARAGQLVDNHTEIDHATPHGTSHEVYKGILDGRARGVFNGRIRVRPDAQKTDAKQTNKTLLLSDTAQINTKPQLEIFANDVKCTHGATVGQLNQDALFYLRARGIDADAARSMLIRAFASDVVERIRVAPLREELDRLLAGRLPGGLTEGAAV